MSPERWRQVESLYNAAVQKNRADRGAFLVQATDGDDELRREVESLLAQDVSNTGRLDRPVWHGKEYPTEAPVGDSSDAGPHP